MTTSKALLRFWFSLRQGGQRTLPRLQLDSECGNSDILRRGAAAMGVELFTFGPMISNEEIGKADRARGLIYQANGWLELKGVGHDLFVPFHGVAPERALAEQAGLIVTRAAPPSPVVASAGSTGLWCDLATAFRALRPYAWGVERVFVRGKPLVAGSKSWALMWAGVSMLPELLPFGRRGDVNPFDEPLVARVERLLTVRSKLELGLATGAIGDPREIEFLADSILVFGTAALDTLACLLAFHHRPTDGRSFRQSLNGLLDPKEGAVRGSIDALTSSWSTSGRARQLDAALKIIYKLRNLVAHRVPSRAQGYRVADRMTGVRRSYYDDPTKTKFRKHVQAQHGGGLDGYSGETQPLIRLCSDVLAAGERLTESSITPLADALQAVGAPMFILVDSDQLYLDPLALADGMTLLVSGLVREALELRRRQIADPPSPRFDALTTHREVLGAARSDIVMPVLFDVGGLLGWFPEPQSRFLL